MFYKIWKSLRFFALIFAASCLVTGCELPTTVEEGQTKISASTDRAPQPGGGATVCNPFGGEAVGAHNGLRASLYHLPDHLPHYERVNDYLANGERLPATLFFDQLNVPTRPFDSGFVTTEGAVLRTPRGDTLYEWFGLRFESELRLTAGDTRGRYQLAVLADDGAIVNVKDSTAWRSLVDSDGTHATRLSVARTPIVLDAEARIPIDVRYFQGPRYHIALQLLWREWPANDQWQDPLDGAEGNYLFFNSDYQPSLPQTAYQQLLSRGWRPVPAKNFFLPDQLTVNPCPPAEPEEPTEEPTEEPGTPPVSGAWQIEGFDASTTTTTANVIWQTTGAPTSTLVRWGLSPGMLTMSTSAGFALVETHLIEVTGLQPGTAYYFQAESTDASGRMVRSPVIHKATK